MKLLLLSILFTLLQAQTVFSDESPSQDTPDDCTLPCRFNLRMSQSKLEECLKANCNYYFRNEQEKSVSVQVRDNVELSGNHGSCVSRCNRLRFGRHKQLQCIDDCDHEYGRSDSRSSSSTSYGNKEVVEQCEARCRRLRFSHDRQLACIQDCHAGYGEEDRSEGDEVSHDESGFNAEELDEDNTNSPGNMNACVSRCKRLRFSRERQDKCIDECGQEKSPSRRSSDIDPNDGEQYDADAPGNRNPCVARCTRLRFSSERQADCINKCPTDAFYARAS